MMTDLVNFRNYVTILQTKHHFNLLNVLIYIYIPTLNEDQEEWQD
jgi:hypothetical protein